MSIPKRIFYCWFGGSPLPKYAGKCIKSWKKYCPDYKITCINEENFDVCSSRYSREAHEAGKWAFVSDYARLAVIFKHGGIYLDTDVEIIKPLDGLLGFGGYMGFDEKGLVATGLGFGAEAGNAVLLQMLKDYEDIPFILDGGRFDLTPCPDRNTATLVKMGMDIKNTHQIFEKTVFLPREYLCPSNYNGGKAAITPNTYSIHHYKASWTSPVAKRTARIKRIIGVKLYDKLYGKFLHKFSWLEW